MNTAQLWFVVPNDDQAYNQYPPVVKKKDEKRLHLTEKVNGMELV